MPPGPFILEAWRPWLLYLPFLLCLFRVPPVALACSSAGSAVSLLCLWRVPLLWCVPPVSLLCLPRVRGCLETAANRTTERKQATSCETTVERGSAVGFRYWNLHAVRALKWKTLCVSFALALLELCLSFAMALL